MKTTKLNFTINYDKLNAHYVFLQFIWQAQDEGTTTWANSFHLDKMLSEHKALATLYREGNTAFVMLLRDTIKDIETFRQQLARQADFYAIKVNIIIACEIKKADSIVQTTPMLSGTYLYQLLFNAIVNSPHDDLLFNNLNGQLVIFPPKAKKKDKYGYHIRIDNDGIITVAVKNYLPKSLVIKDEKNPIIRANKLTKPAYYLSHHRMERDFTGKDMQAYVQAGRNNHHAQADALDVRSHDLFAQSRLGVIFATVNAFNQYYRGMAKVNFTDTMVSNAIAKRFHLLKNDKQFDQIAQTLNIKLIDKINTPESSTMLANIQQVLDSLAVTSNIIKRETPTAQHLCLVKPKDFYQNNPNSDPYKQDDRYSRQHLTDEQYQAFMDADTTGNKKRSVLLKNLLKELWLKQAVQTQQMPIDMLKISYPLTGTWVFGIIARDGYHLLAIDDTGKMQYFLHDLSDFFPAHPYVAQLDKVRAENQPFSELDDSPIEAFIISPHNDINIILRSDECVIPDLARIEAEIRQKDAKIPPHLANPMALITMFESCQLPLDDTWFNFIDQLLEMKQPIDKEALRKLINTHYGKGSKNTEALREALLQQGIKLGFSKSAPALQEKMGDLLTIHAGFNDEKTAWYSVGYYLESFQHSLPHMVHLREVKTLQGNNLMDELLPLMDVDFVRYNNYTVLPFPLKYLREMAIIGVS